jgi:hypothetical protein
MTHLSSRDKNASEHFEVIDRVNSSSDSPVNHALISMAQEVAELLKQAYPVKAEDADSKLLAYCLDGN